MKQRMKQLLSNLGTLVGVVRSSADLQSKSGVEIQTVQAVESLSGLSTVDDDALYLSLIHI